MGLRPRRGAVGAAFPSGKSLPPSAKQGNDTPHPRGAGGSPLVLTAPTAEAWKPLRSGTEAHSVWGPRGASEGPGGRRGGSPIPLHLMSRRQKSREFCKLSVWRF